MMRIPGQGGHVPAPLSSKDAKPKEAVPEEVYSRPIPPPKEGSKGPELDARAIAVRMAALAAQAKEKELSFEEIIERLIDETGMTNPQAAVEEADRKLQKEIEDVLQEIKSNKDLMEEAESWQTFGELLQNELNQEQIGSFLDLLKESVKGL